MTDRIAASALLVSLVAAAWWPATGCAGTGSDATFPVTIIGIDGATWRILDPMLARNHLPNLGRLVAHGVRAPLRSRMPLWSPAVWTTIATGVRRERHGITNFLNAEGRLTASVERRSPTLWTLASAARRRIAVVGWWVTYPAESVHGVIVSERAFTSREADLRAMTAVETLAVPRRRLFHPPEIGPLVAEILGGLPERPKPEEIRETTVARMRAEDSAAVALLRRLRRQRGPFDLEMILLRGTDPISHYFWKFHEPHAPAYERVPSPDEMARYGTAVEDHYRYVDDLLGQLGAGETPDHVCIVVSDHGFEAGGEGDLTGRHESPSALHGVFIASGGSFRRGTRLDRLTILDIAPTVLYLLGLPIADTLEGRVLTEALDATWMAAHPVRRIRAYAGPAVALPPDDNDVLGADSPADAEFRDRLRALGYIEHGQQNSDAAEHRERPLTHGSR